MKTAIRIVLCVVFSLAMSVGCATVSQSAFRCPECGSMCRDVPNQFHWDGQSFSGNVCSGCDEAYEKPEFLDALVDGEMELERKQ